jgi:ribosomal protein L14
MHVEYVFLLRSQVNLGLGDWEPLSFQRNGFQVRIPKPTSDTSFYIKIRPSGGPVVFDISRFKPGWGIALHATMVSIQLESPLEVPEDKIDQASQPIAQEIFNHFKSWIRVLTRQHWIGYQESAFPQQDFNVNVITGEVRKPLSTGGVSVGFDYWKPLDQRVWSALGEKLAKGRLPSAGQLFFCDSLVDIGAGDLAQAVVELGAACELEVYSTITDSLQVRKAAPKNLKKVERLNFARKVKLLGSLNGNSFKRFDANAARLVNKLYGMRGTAIHRADLPFVDNSKSPMWNASQLIRFVHAVERLLGWLDIQRSALV